MNAAVKKIICIACWFVAICSYTNIMFNVSVQKFSNPLIWKFTLA